MSSRNSTGARLAVIGSYQGILDNWKKRAAATAKDSLTIRFAGPQKTRKDTEDNTCFGEVRAVRSQQWGLT